jgi:chaperonin GroES
MNIKPLADRVIVKPSGDEQKTAGGIIIPDTAKEKPSKGEVVAVGPGKVTDDGKRIPVEVKVGDMILFGKYSGTEFEFKGEKYLIMRDNEIYAIL